MSNLFTNIEVIPLVYLIAFIVANGLMILGVGKLLSALDIDSPSVDKTKFSAAIGFFERILYFVAFVNYDIQFLGLLLILKTIIRFPEVKEQRDTHFAEKYILGTLVNLLFAYIAAYILIVF